MICRNCGMVSAETETETRHTTTVDVATGTVESHEVVLCETCSRAFDMATDMAGSRQ